MKIIQALLMGAGVVVINISASFIQTFRPERCTGICGTCSMACIEPLVGMTATGLLVVAVKKVKNRIFLKKKPQKM